MGREGVARVWQSPGESWRTMADTALVDAMRASDACAWAEYHARFRPLLELYGRRIGISAWFLDEYVATALDDAALHLTASTTAPPRLLAGYLCRVLRNHALMARRAEQRRDRHQRDAADVRYGEHAVRSLCSEHALRVSDGASMTLVDGEGERADFNSGRTALAAALRARLSVEERRLIAWVEDAVPCREIAGWLGITYDAAAKRIARLKQKLRALAPECITTLDDEQRRELARLLPTIAGSAGTSSRRSPSGDDP